MLQVSKLQKYEPLDWAGLTTENHLGAMYLQEPELVSPLIEQIYSVNLGDDIITKVNQFPVKELNDDVPYEWYLQGADEKSIPLVGIKNMAGTALTATSKPGLNNTRFVMTFGEKYFDVTHVIVGEKPDAYALHIVDVVPTGNGYDYTVELQTGNRDLFVPFEDLFVGSNWSIDYSISEQTLSTRGSGTHHTSPFKMQNFMSQIRKQEVVPGNMILKGKNKPFAFSFKSPDGKVQTTWLNKLDYDFYTQFRREQARMFMYGKSNKREDGTFGNTGDSGYEKRTGSGLREQIAPANQYYYNDFDIEQLVDFALDQLSIGKLPEDARQFTLMTGEHGLKVFSRAVEAYAGAQALSYQRISGISGGKGGSFERPQFVRLADINGIRFEVMHNPDYDNFIRNKKRHSGGGTVESHRFTILDFGTDRGEANIRKVTLKGQSEIYSCVEGIRSPYTPTGKNAPSKAASSLDGYELHRMAIFGCMIKNPLRCGEFISTESL